MRLGRAVSRLSRLICCLGLLCLPVLKVFALPIESHYQPGQLVVGWLKPGSQAWLDGEEIAISTAGLLAFGFGRDDAGVHQLQLLTDGHTSTHSLQVMARDYQEQHVKGLASKYVKPDPAVVKRIRQDSRAILDVRDSVNLSNALNGQFMWPVKGRLSGVFGSRRILNGVPKSPHKGIDIAAAEGAPVVAPIAGKVVLVAEDMFYTGKTVMLDHGLGVTSVYAHLQAIKVKQGQILRQGEVLGLLGQTGRATGPHLHFGISWKRKALDPLLVMPQ